MWGWFSIRGYEAADGFLIGGEKVIAAWAMDGDLATRFAPAYLLPGSVKQWTETLRVSDVLTTGMLSQARSGKMAGWSIPKDAPDFYREQLAARIFDETKKTWRTVGKCGEHLWDCERYALAAAFMAGCFCIQKKEQ